jgi:hypothetical protein
MPELTADTLRTVRNRPKHAKTVEITPTRRTRTAAGTR